MNCRVILVAFSLCAVFAHTSVGQVVDAVSREVSVFNDLAISADAVDALSRDISVLNNLAPASLATESTSREVTVLNDLAPAFVPSEADSREVVVFNDLAPLLAIIDAVSRNISVQNVYLCSGNLTDDGLVTHADVTPFIQVLLGFIIDPQLHDAADMNCDGKEDGRDIQLFVDALLSP